MGGAAGGGVPPRARHQVPRGHGARLASRHARIRRGSRRLLRQPHAHAFSPLPAGQGTRPARLCPPPRAALGLRHAARHPLEVAAQHPADQGAALFGNLPHHAPPADTRMSVRIVRLGTPRARGEGVRIGTVRRPPRGVRKTEYASRDFYDVWFPALAPSLATMKLGLSAKTDAQWKRFAKKYRAEMARPDASHAAEVLAKLSRTADFSVGCYCEDENRCHRSLLRRIVIEKGAK